MKIEKRKEWTITNPRIFSDKVNGQNHILIPWDLRFSSNDVTNMPFHINSLQLAPHISSAYLVQPPLLIGATCCKGFQNVRGQYRPPHYTHGIDNSYSTREIQWNEKLGEKPRNWKERNSLVGIICDVK